MRSQGGLCLQTTPELRGRRKAGATCPRCISWTADVQSQAFHQRHLQLQTQTEAKGNAALPPRLLEVFITAVSVFLHDERVGLLW